LGKPQAAATLLRELSDRAAHTYLSETELILAADAAGDRDLAIRSAERAWADREPMFILLARHPCGARCDPIRACRRSCARWTSNVHPRLMGSWA
jgi:hypothetical protein